MHLFFQRMSRISAVLFMIVLAAVTVWSQDKRPAPVTLPLWPAGAPFALGNSPDDQPRITVFLPARQSTRTAVVLCPGGAYAMLATDHEGKQVAQWFNNLGVAVFMLEYRLGPKYHHPVELGDAKRAIRWVRAHAADYNVDPAKVGIMGFSAGGHLASTVATHFDLGNSGSADGVERQSSRPDFAILIYPVIGPLGNASVYSFEQLLGKNPDQKLVEELTNDLHVTPQTPPTFLIHSDNDDAVTPENSVRFYAALKRAGVPAEMHIYPTGGHGYGLAPYDPVLSTYPPRIVDWLRGRGLL